MSHGRWWGSLLPLNHLRTAASPCPRWFPLKFGNFCQDMEWQRMVVWASILQSTADIRHLYRFAKEIHQKKAKSMVFQYSKYLVDFNKISPIPSWKKPWDTNLMSRTSTEIKLGGPSRRGKRPRKDPEKTQKDPTLLRKRILARFFLFHRKSSSGAAF